MYYDNEEVESRYKSYRFWSTFFAISTVVVGVGIFGVAMSFVIQRPWFEGGLLGMGFGAILVHLQFSGEGFEEYWEEQTKKDFEAEEQLLEDEWEKERNRPEDEYVGW
jgi:hypothetical protein